MHPLLLLLLALLPLLTSPPAAAETPATSPAFGEEIVVSAARVEERRGEVAGHVTVIGGAEVAGAAAGTVDEVLRGVSGFSLFRRTSSLTAHPTSQGASLRGIAPSGVSRVLVLLDGVPLNDDFGGWVAWGKVATEEVERIEVVPGGGAQVWGNYALGGVIQLVTAAPSAGEVSVAGRLGERREGAADLRAAERWTRSWGDVGALFGASLFDTEGYPVVRADQRGAVDVPATSSHETFTGRVQIAPDDRQSFEVRVRRFDEERGNGTSLTGNDTESTQLVLAGHHLRGGGLWEGTLSAADQRFSSTFSAVADDRASEQPALDQFRVDAESLAGSVQWSRAVGERHRLSAGGDFRTVEGATHEDFRNLGAGFTRRRRAGGEQRLGGLYVQDIVTLGEDWRLVAGARVDSWRHLEGERVERDLATGEALRADRFADRDEVAVSPRLAARRRLGPRLSGRAAVYGGFRAPTLNELYRPFRVGNDVTEANPELERERLWGAELGLDAWGRRGDVRFTAFWNRLEDAVANVTVGPGPGVVEPCGFVPDGGTCRQRRNLELGRVRGLEVDGRWRPGGAWLVEASYLWSDGEVVEAAAQPALAGRPLAQVPEHQATVRLSRRPPERLSFWLQTRWLDEQLEDDLGTRRLAAATLVDLRLDRPLAGGWEVYAGVENLFDEEVETGRGADGLVSVGAPRRLHAGVRWSRRGR